MRRGGLSALGRECRGVRMDGSWQWGNADSWFEFWSDARGGPACMMPIQDCSLNWWRRHDILGHVSRPEIWTTGFGTQFGLHINTLFQEDSFQQRVLVAQHQAFIRSMAVSGLKVGQVLLMSPDGFLKLLDVLGA